MSNGTEDGSPKLPGAAGGELPAEWLDLINQKIAGAVGAQIRRHLSPEAMSKAIERQLEAIADHAVANGPTNQPKAAAVDTPQNEKLNMRSMKEEYDSKIKAIEAKFQIAEKARQEAEHKAVSTRIRADVASQFARRMGADSPFLEAAINNEFEVKKRFIATDGGGYGVKFKREWGDEVVPADQAWDELWQGDLKAYATPSSRAAGLPPNNMRGQHGQPHIANGQPGGGRPNPLHEVAAAHYAAMGQGDVAAAFAQSSKNGTSK